MDFPEVWEHIRFPETLIFSPESADIKALLPKQESLATVKLDHDMTTLHRYYDIDLTLWHDGRKADFLVFQWWFLHLPISHFLRSERYVSHLRFDHVDC